MGLRRRVWSIFLDGTKPPIVLSDIVFVDLSRTADDITPCPSTTVSADRILDYNYKSVDECYNTLQAHQGAMAALHENMKDSEHAECSAQIFIRAEL